MTNPKDPNTKTKKVAATTCQFCLERRPVDELGVCEQCWEGGVR